MAEAELKNNYLSLYAQNADWKERVLKDDCEIVKYQNDSSVRIWYNEQSESYAPHWHTAMEVIMPVENYYDGDDFEGDGNYTKTAEFSAVIEGDGTLRAGKFTLPF